MEGLLAILFFILIGSMVGRSKKKTAAPGGTPKQPAAGKAAPGEMPKARVPAGLNYARQIEEMLRSFERQALPEEPAPAPAVQGTSLSDDEGCVGGSMPHTHTEGESREEHGRHREAVRRREAKEIVEQAASEREALRRAQDLRRAVVMAEVLNRPVALREQEAGKWQ